MSDTAVEGLEPPHSPAFFRNPTNQRWLASAAIL